MRRNRLLHLFVYACAVASLFLLPFQAQKRGEPTWLDLIGADKIFHALVFFGFVWLYVRWRQELRAAEWFLLFGGLALFGGAIEALQGAVGTHTVSFWDWLADMSGVCAGCWFTLRRHQHRRQSPQDSPSDIPATAPAALPSEHQAEQAD